LIGMVTEQPFAETKGIVAALADSLNHEFQLDVRGLEAPHIRPGRGCELILNNKRWGWMGELSDQVRESLDLRDPVTVVEVEHSLLEEIANLQPTFKPVGTYPCIERDLNFLLDLQITWKEIVELVSKEAGSLLENVSFGGQYQGKQIPTDKKSYLLKLSYRSPERTLTTEEVDAIQQRIIESCRTAFGATLR